MSQASISVEGLSKAYRIGLKEEIPDTLMGAVTGVLKAPWRNFQRLRSLNTFMETSHTPSQKGVQANGKPHHAVAEPAPPPEDIIWALKDISFEVEEGQVVGIIGRNGAGKSTLLKILSRITEPTQGRAIIRGRVASLLEVGTGFHQELTGRENVYMNGTILGMTKPEIDRKFDEIVEFSGVEKFLDTPIKRYSSGMKVRLAFAVAAHLEPEILIIDEVLAVGDAEFQRKCLGKMQDVAEGGRTVLFVSHNMAAVENLCPRAILLAEGGVELDADVNTVIGEYLTGGQRTNDACVDLATEDIVRQGSGAVRWTQAAIHNVDNVPSCRVAMGESFCFHLNLEAVRDVDDVVVAVGIFKQPGVRVCGLNSEHTARFTMSIRAGRKYTLKCSLDCPPLAPGSYYANLQLKTTDGEVLDMIENALHLTVSPRDVYKTGCVPTGHNIVTLYPEWSLT